MSNLQFLGEVQATCLVNAEADKCFTDPISIRYGILTRVPVVDNARKKGNAAQNQQNSQCANCPIGEADKKTDKKRANGKLSRKRME